MDRTIRRRLGQRLVPFEEFSTDRLLQELLDSFSESGLELFPAQEEAILELLGGKNLILNTPTGSGKSLVATALHYISSCQGQRSVYTSPIKALVNEKFLALVKEFGAKAVGLITGDGSVNRDAPILCCTAEILANWALRDGAKTPVDDVIMDEFHFYSDRERGMAWQVPLLTLPHSRFLLMSATLGEVDFFQEQLSELTGRETACVRSSDRPVPLEFNYLEIPLHEALADLIKLGKTPVYVVCFTQREASEQAQNLLSVDFLTREEKKTIYDMIAGVSFRSPFGKTLERLLRHGVGLHHAGLLPRYRLLVERLAQTGLLRVVCGTDTLGVGINVPIRTVVFTKLCKFDGQKTSLLTVRDFHQIAGRAGRKGFDSMGTVEALAPEHVIENRRLEQKALADPKKAKKLVRLKPPEKGYVHWDESTYRRLISATPEKLESRFSVDVGVILNVLSRGQRGISETPCQDLRRLIGNSHETPQAKKRHRSLAVSAFRALRERGVIASDRSASGLPIWKLNVELQNDFSLHQTLSLFLLDVIEVLAEESDADSYQKALDLLSALESILESPESILNKQRDRARNLLYHELKAQDVEYDERQERLEKVEHPQPLREFLEPAFADFLLKHPWVKGEDLKPKSIARELFERGMTFAEFVRSYEIERGEGLLLRYLSDVYRVLSQTVPEKHKSDPVRQIESDLREIIRGVDSSLLDEWQRLQRAELGPGDESVKARQEAAQRQQEEWERELHEKELAQAKRRVVSEVFLFLREWGQGRIDEAVERLGVWSEQANLAWTRSRLEEVLSEFSAEGRKPRTDGYAKFSQHQKWQIKGLGSESPSGANQKAEAPHSLILQIQDTLELNEAELEVRFDLGTRIELVRLFN